MRGSWPSCNISALPASLVWPQSSPLLSRGRAARSTRKRPWFPPLHYQAFAATLLIAAACAALGNALRVPSGRFLLTLAIGAILNVSGVVEFELPRWLLTGTFAAVGWSVGLHFTPEILAAALRAFPKVLLSVALLIAFSAGVGFLLTQTLGIDPLTAYLATSPGGMDSVAIIAASSHVDVSFVITLQMVRFLTIVAFGPPIARFLARRAAPRRGLYSHNVRSAQRLPLTPSFSPRGEGTFAQSEREIRASSLPLGDRVRGGTLSENGRFLWWLGRQGAGRSSTWRFLPTRQLDDAVFD